MSQTAEDILTGDDYFRCERYRCIMKKAHCVERRQALLRVPPGVVLLSHSCKGCEQAEKDERPTSNVEHRMMNEKPVMPGRRCGRKPAVSQEGVRIGFKRCSKCEEVKRRNEFYIRAAYRDGRSYECKECYRAYNNERSRRKRLGLLVNG